jgi:WD40 repeat protein
MVIQSLENILKLIFNNFNKSDLDNLFDKINNETIAFNSLKLLDYKNIFTSLGKSQILLERYHNDPITALLELSDGNIISASWDGKMKIWNIVSDKCISIPEDHTCAIRDMIKLPNGNIASSSLNGEIKIWDPIKGYQCIQTIHIDGYSKFNKLIALPNNDLVSTSVNMNIPRILVFVYNSEYSVTRRIKQENKVLCLTNLLDNKFASGSQNTEITLWDMNKNPANYNVLKGHRMHVLCLIFKSDNNLLYSGAGDGKIKVWDCIDCKCIKTFNAHDGSVTCLILLSKGYFASGSNDNKIKIWDRNNACINSFYGGKTYITSLLLLKDYRIASSSSQEYSIKIFNYEI